VTASAEELGQLTTRAVVEAIFLVIIADAVFSIIYTELDI
jgi:phospholipid/cholesterol/gamma-HCH transport system permease protein